MRGLRRRCSSGHPAASPSASLAAFSLGFLRGEESRPPPHSPPLPSTPPAPGRAPSKRCNASWRCHCHQPGRVLGSCRAGEGADLRKSLRVLSRRKRSRWGRGRPPRDQWTSPGAVPPSSGRLRLVPSWALLLPAGPQQPPLGFWTGAGGRGEVCSGDGRGG